ncbi:hypothetical protein GGTG_13029 [Gaeumannomyces tritici R3-111a-1]|uniref:Uncharacterized protein n=1 Tax=Gaeumannomyces tritici (strain R3-111a-1) TaxID=644352 RepID=J3PHP8_GAET3|nr:hypothetical protein GGTG_13029 [Gaeumannomyces tritici R3-111a-1]EJT69410.1 hypothetical protein GGTG_13029 [Gaeumannomyces tritici R3-111a-1]
MWWCSDSSDSSSLDTSSIASSSQQYHHPHYPLPSTERLLTPRPGCPYYVIQDLPSPEEAAADVDLDTVLLMLDEGSAEARVFADLVLEGPGRAAFARRLDYMREHAHHRVGQSRPSHSAMTEGSRRYLLRLRSPEGEVAAALRERPDGRGRGAGDEERERIVTRKYPRLVAYHRAHGIMQFYRKFAHEVEEVEQLRTFR